MTRRRDVLEIAFPLALALAGWALVWWATEEGRRGPL